ncbi:hypothetical protein C0992_005893 [Termitomyces sp. T32_za158]|nr:hypothetical protein C0992_005893 [Termitomyces sp. T32_za158]
MRRYGITQQWQRSLILDHSVKLKQSMLRKRNSTTSDFCVRRLSRSDSFSSFPGQHQHLLDEDDSAYLSSSSSISSTSSINGHAKRRLRPNGRVHGLVVSYERSTSPDKTQLRRGRSESASSIHDEHRSFLPQHNGDNHSRPLPFPPHSAREYDTGPLLLPQVSFPQSFPQSLNMLQSTGNSSQVTPLQITRNDITVQTTGPLNYSRPLPATPLHPLLRHPPLLDEDLADDSTIASRNASGEMTMDELISVLDNGTELSQPQTFVDHCNTQKSEKRKKMGAAAWEMDIGETIKHVPQTALLTVAQAQSDGSNDELTVDELLALEGGAGATAWVNKPVGGNGQEIEVPSFESIQKSRSAVKDVDCTSSAKRKSRGYGHAKYKLRRVGELFSPEHGVDEAHGKEKQLDADALEAKEKQSRELAAAEQRRQENVEQCLSSSVAENRRLLEEFRRRLERVEQRVEDLEAPSKSLPLAPHENPNACVVRRLRTLAAWALSTSLPAVLGVPLANLVRSPDTSIGQLGDGSSKTTDIPHEKSKTVASQHSKAFPRYALIFGFGICAFMLRGFLRLGVKGVRIGATGVKGVKGR